MGLAAVLYVYLLWVNTCLAYCLNSVLNVKAVVAAFNQEKALVGAFSMITNLQMELFQALVHWHWAGLCSSIIAWCMSMCPMVC